jgi:hypothetical protein
MFIIYSYGIKRNCRADVIKHKLYYKAKIMLDFDELLQDKVKSTYSPVFLDFFAILEIL